MTATTESDFFQYPQGPLLYGVDYLDALESVSIPDSVRIWDASTGLLCKPAAPWMRWRDSKTGASGWGDQSLLGYLCGWPHQRMTANYRVSYDDPPACQTLLKVPACRAVNIEAARKQLAA